MATLFAILLCAGLPYPDFALPVPKFEPEPVNQTLTLLVYYDAGCRKAVLAQAHRLGEKRYNVLVCDSAKATSQDYLARRGRFVRYPLWILWRGHEAQEFTEREATDRELGDWVWRIYRGERSTGRFHRDTSQDWVTGADRVWLRSYWTGSTCNMYWCQLHGAYIAHEYATKPDEPPPPKPKPKPQATCPTGGCPNGRCPVR